MIKIKAKIKLYDGKDVRQSPFINGYRPLFNFILNTKNSGSIALLDRSNFYPGDEAIVEVTFVDNVVLSKNIEKGTRFTFDEGSKTLGEGEVLEVLEKPVGA